MKKFPTADDARKMKPYEASLFVLDQEIKAARRMIMYAIADGRTQVKIWLMKPDLKTYLEELGYTVFRDTDMEYIVSWGDGDGKQRDRDINEKNKEYATGGLVAYSNFVRLLRDEVCQYGGKSFEDFKVNLNRVNEQSPTYINNEDSTKENL